MELTVAEWVADELRRLERFARACNAGHEAQPDSYPSTLEPPEWDELFRCFET